MLCSLDRRSRTSFSFRLPYISSHSLASPLFLVYYLSYHLSFEQRQLFSLLFPSLLYASFGFFVTILLFSSLYIPICTLTRSNSRLRLSLLNSSHSITFAFLVCSSIPAKKSRGWSFASPCRSLLLHSVVRRNTTSFFPTLINTVPYTAIFPMVCNTSYSTDIFKTCGNTDLFPHKAGYTLAFLLPGSFL